MRLSMKARYALTALLDIYQQAGTTPVSLADISDRQDVSQSYLEQIFAKLKAAELVVSTRGPGGGYRLNQDPTLIKIIDITQAVDDPNDAELSSEARAGHVHTPPQEMAEHLWQRLGDEINAHLATVTLADVLQQRPNALPRKANKAA